MRNTIQPMKDPQQTLWVWGAGISGVERGDTLVHSWRPSIHANHGRVSFMMLLYGILLPLFQPRASKSHLL